MKLLSRLLNAAMASVLILGITSCDLVTPPKSELKVSGKTMGTIYNITVIGDYPGGTEQLRSDAEMVLTDVNKKISAFDPESELSKFNKSKTTDYFKVSQDLADVVIAGLRAGNDLGGAVDITVAPLVDIWGFGIEKKDGKIPSAEEVEAAKALTGLDKLHIEVSAASAAIKKDIPDLRVDLSTVGEGYGADKLSELMDRKGVQNYMVSVAGAVRTRGTNSRDTDWVIAIEHPTNEQNLGKRFEVPVCTDGMALSTSGSYRNYITDSKTGKRLSHIIDPSTGSPIEHNTVSVTVVGPNALWTDAVDTGFMVMGSQKALTYANERNIAIYTIVKTDNGFESHASRAMERYLTCD